MSHKVDTESSLRFQSVVILKFCLQIGRENSYLGLPFIGTQDSTNTPGKLIQNNKSLDNL